jgi:hypothetical protein
MLSNIRAINKHFIEKSTSYCLNHTPNASITMENKITILKNRKALQEMLDIKTGDDITHNNQGY